MGKLGGADEVQSRFSAKYQDLYRDLMDELLAQGQDAEAFRVLERSRARVLLSMLGERDLVLTHGLPDGLVRQRKRLAAEVDRAQARLATLEPARNAAEIEQVLGTLRDLRDQRQQLRDQVRRLSPRLAALEDPRPLDPQAAAAALDPGTLLLEYSVGSEQSWLFLVGAGIGPGKSLSVIQINAGEVALRRDVEAFRRLTDGLASGPESDRAVCGLGKKLYDTLIRPAESQIAAAQRLLISPDGPLHLLPYAALVRAQDDSVCAAAPPPGSYLIEEKPLHTVVSATLYADLLRDRNQASQAGGPELLAFGDPLVQPIDPKAGPDVSGASKLRVAVAKLAPEALPGTKAEVEALGRLYGAGARVHVGAEATEDRVKAEAPAARRVHLACHSLLDARRPLDSALVFSIPPVWKPGQENGLLQAWEIFEGMRLHADLVVLSACQTGLGEEAGGEGLLGLTRAFQYAGARSIVASLWRVSDASAAPLMERFHAGLLAGESKDRALRDAQIALLRGPGWATRLEDRAVRLVRDRLGQVLLLVLAALGLAAVVQARRGRRRALKQALGWTAVALLLLAAVAATLPPALDTAAPFHWAAFELIGDWK